ncbi:MAG: hypothetical protein ACYCZY_13120 [Lacisediminihabitans sp.]
MGSVTGHDVGHGPVVSVGDEDSFAEGLGLEAVSGVLVEVPVQAQLGRGLAGEGCGDHVGRTQ